MSLDVLLFVPDKEKALREVARILKPGARFAGTTLELKTASTAVSAPPFVAYPSTFEAAGFVVGFDKGNGAALVNHSREKPNCYLLRQRRKVWLVAGIEGIKAGDELTYDYGSEYYPRNGRKRK